ncbi:MAG: hypothetical protein Q7T16_03445, partial [Candidatus Burarchaeum sp.]
MKRIRGMAVPVTLFILMGIAYAANLTGCGIVTEDSVLVSDIIATGNSTPGAPCIMIGASNIYLDCAG